MPTEDDPRGNDAGICASVGLMSDEQLYSLLTGPRCEEQAKIITHAIYQGCAPCSGKFTDVIKSVPGKNLTQNERDAHRAAARAALAARPV